MGTVARTGIHAIDAILRRAYGVEEFTDDAACLLRLAPGRARQEVILSDGTEVHLGQVVGELHLWNEHIPTMDVAGPDLGWSLRFYRQLEHSLAALATHVAHSPRYGHVRVFRGDTILIPTARSDFAVRLGFDLIWHPPANAWGRFAQFWENLYAWWLIWAYNPGSLKGKRFWQLERSQLWISREKLLEWYGVSEQ